MTLKSVEVLFHKSTQYSASVNNTPSDSLVAVMEECSSISAWKVLGPKLGLDIADIDRIEKDEKTELSRQQAMFIRWIDTGSASWRGLADALIKPPLKANRVAKNIAIRHPVKK